MLETVGSKYRVLTGAFMNTGLSVGLVTLGLVAWLVPNWRPLTLVLSIPQLFILTYLWLMSESVRWYMTKNRFKDCEKALKNIATVNKRHLSDKSLELLREISEDDKNNRIDLRVIEQNKNKLSLFGLLLKHKPVLFRCLITPFWWITFTFIFHGLTINAVGISGNKYFNYMAVSAAQIPGFWIANFLLDRIGRKPTLTGAYWICAACLAGYIFMPKGELYKQIYRQYSYFVS